MHALIALLLAGTIFVSNEEANLVHVIDAATMKEREPIRIGNGPRGMVLSPDGRSLLVAVSKDNRIAVVDVASGKVTGHVPSGADPETFAVSPDGKRLYAANEDDNLLSVIDVDGQEITNEISVGGEPEGTAVSPDGKLVVQTSESASMAHVVDAATGEVIDNLLVDTRPRYVAFTPDGKQFWVSSEIRGTVTIFDAATRKILGKIDFQPLGKDNPPDRVVQPVGIIFTGNGERAFVALGRAGLVAEVDPKRFTLIRTFQVGWRAWNLALSPDETRIYTANGLTGDMSAIDIVANKPLGTVKLGGKPWGIVAAR
jgi:PQQ-dependent catabolism-associated beta-propeller protein